MKAGAIATVGVGALACTGCSGWQSALDPHSVHAETLTQLIHFMVAVCGTIWVLVTAVLLMALWRRKRPRADEMSLEAHREKKMFRTITAATLATLVVVLVLTVVSFLATRRIGTANGQALVIQVRGWQWWWEVTYPDARSDRTLKTANEIHVPVGRPVRIELSAADVIHSFWIPNLAGKQDMIPGRDNALTFTARQPGVYRGQCAEFCGLQHAHMAMLVIADEPAVFDAWRAGQLADAGTPAAAEEEAGRQVFTTKACASCHAVRGTSANGTAGPDLTHVASRRTIAAGLFDTTRGSLAAWVADPQTLKPGNNMPMVELQAGELQSVSAYLASLK